MTDCTCVKTHDVQENAHGQEKSFFQVGVRNDVTLGDEALRLHGDGVWESCNAVGGVVRLK